MNKFLDIQKLNYARREGIDSLKLSAARNTLLQRIKMRGIIERWHAINTPEIAGKRLSHSNKSLFNRFV